MQRVVIIGAGISGLALACRLQEQLPDADIVVLEQDSRVGGTIDTRQRSGFTVEAGPNGFPDNNLSTLDLSRSVGLESRLVAASEAAGRNRFLMLAGRLRLLPASLGAFLQTDLLSWFAKFQLFVERLRPRRHSYRDESIDSFARRRVGGEIASTLVDAFVTGILAGDPKLLSVQAAFPRLVTWEREYGSVQGGMAASRKQRQQAGGIRRGNMWSFQGGLRTLTDTLAARLRTPPLLGVSVRRVLRQEAGWVVEADGKDRWTASAVVLACPAYRQADIVADLDGSLAEVLRGIAYNRVAVVALGYRRSDMPHSLDGFGYLSPQRERRDILGVQWCSSIYPGRAPEGMVLLRAMCGGWHRGEMVDWSDDRLLAAVRAELGLALGVQTAPAFVEIIRWHRAIPQYHLGHLDRVAWIDRRLIEHPGLFVAGNAYRGVSINDCVEQAGIRASRVAGWLQADQRS